MEVKYDFALEYIVQILQRENETHIIANYITCSDNLYRYFLTTKKQTAKFSSARFQKNVKSKLDHIENSKTRGQTV